MRGTRYKGLTGTPHVLMQASLVGNACVASNFAATEQFPKAVKREIFYRLWPWEARRSPGLAGAVGGL
jgi:hypothetical protein